MGIDTPPPDDSTFNPELLGRVEIVEALPFSHAFERVMHDHRIHRHAHHTMHDPIQLTSGLTGLIIPMEMRATLPSSNSRVADLVVDHYDIPPTDHPLHASDTPRLALSFTADGLQHSMQTYGDHMIHEIETHTDTLRYEIDLQVAMRFLAALVYARQYDEGDPEAPISYIEGDRDLSRSEDDSLIEQLLLTLGTMDGQSTITTTSLIATAEGDSLVALLSEGESPIANSMQSKLELARFASILDSTQTNLHQNIVNTGLASIIHPEPVTLIKRFAEQCQPETEPIIIDPKDNFQEWVAVCDTFLTAIEPHLDQYAYLDEEPV